MTKIKPDIYKGKPWRNLDEYVALSLKYGLFGEDLAAAIKRDNKHKIPFPRLKVPKNAIVEENEALYAI